MGELLPGSEVKNGTTRELDLEEINSGDDSENEEL